MPLQYQLYTPLPVPKLDSMTFLIGYDPSTIMLYSHRVHPITVAGELQQTLAELRAGFTGSGCIELSKPERLVNRASLPSGVNAIGQTEARCPLRRSTKVPATTPQTRMTVSMEPMAMKFASGENIISAKTSGPSPIGGTFDSCVFKSHIRAALSSKVSVSNS